MKLVAAVLSVLHPYVTVLLLLPLIGWAVQAAALPAIHELSPPLANPTTYKIVGEVSKKAQEAAKLHPMEDDTSTRLIPSVSYEKNHLKICCLHANLLDFYLHNILPQQRHETQRLMTDLTRVSEDLQSNGCNVTQYHDHPVVEEFYKKFGQLGERRVNKALGEIDILFGHLSDYCVAPKDAAAAF